MEKYVEYADYSWSSDSIRYIATPSPTAKSIYYYIQEAGHFKTTPPYFTKRKNLHSFLIVFTLSGEGILEYEDKTYTLASGQAFFINCMTAHHYYTKKDSNWEFLWLHFEGSNSLGYYEEFTKNGFSIITIKDRDSFALTMRRILSLHQKKDFSAEILSSSLIVSLLTELLLSTNDQQGNYIFIPPAVKTAQKYIDKNFGSSVTLDILSKECNTSKFHLSRQFKQSIGTTIKEYLILARLSHAKELLKYSDMPVQKIAFESGFNNVSHFICIFKEHENVTPLAFRREWQMLAQSKEQSTPHD